MPRVKQFNEEKVLQKAVELFWKQGFHATSMQDLVSELGINRASLYDTFGGKQALFDKAFQCYREKSFQETVAFLNGFDSVKEALLRLLEKSAQRCINDPDNKGCFAVNTATAQYIGDNPQSVCLSENRTLYIKIFSDQVKKGMQNGEIPKDRNPEQIGTLLFVLLSGINVVAKMNPDQEVLIASIHDGLKILD